MNTDILLHLHKHEHVKEPKIKDHFTRLAHYLLEQRRQVNDAHFIICVLTVISVSIL
jgi:hypothetical protein